MTYTSPYGAHDSYDFVWETLRKYDQLGYSAGDVASNEYNKLWIAVRAGIVSGTETGTVWIDGVGGSASVTLQTYQPGFWNADPSIKEIAEYDVVTKTSTLIFRTERWYENPVTSVDEQETTWSLDNNGVRYKGYNDSWTKTLDNYPEFLPDGVFYNPSIGDPGYVGVFPDRYLFYVDWQADWFPWSGWTFTEYSHSQLLVHEGQLYIIAHSNVFAPPSSTAYIVWLGLFRYNNTGTWERGSWTLEKIWELPPKVSSSSGMIRMMAMPKKETGSQANDIHSAYIQVINTFLNSGQGVVNYGGQQWEDCVSDETDGNIDFTDHAVSSGGAPWNNYLYYGGTDGAGSWIWRFWPRAFNETDNRWVRSQAITGSLGGTSGFFMTKTIAGDWQIQKWFSDLWWDTGSATPIPIFSTAGAAVALGYTQTAQIVHLSIFEGWNGIWHSVTSFAVESTFVGVHSIWAFGDPGANPEEPNVYVILNNSVYTEAGVHDDHVYVGTWDFFYWAPPWLPSYGLYTGTFDPMVVDIEIDENPSLEKVRTTFWRGQEPHQRIFQVSRNDERVYLSRPYDPEASAEMVARYTPPYTSELELLGGGSILSDGEDITDNISWVDGIFGLDLTDGV